MKQPFEDQEIMEPEYMEEQPLTDPDVQEDFVLVRGEDGEMHRVVPVPEEVKYDVVDN